MDGKKDDKTRTPVSIHIKKDIKTDPSLVGTTPHKVQNGNTPLAPSARISALNIVGDLLRKVGVSLYVVNTLASQMSSFNIPIWYCNPELHKTSTQL